MQWPPNWRGAFVLGLTFLLMILGFAEFILYIYVKLTISLDFGRSHCWLWSGLLTCVLAASTIFMFVSLKRRPDWLVILHFVALFIAQTVGWIISEIFEWRLLWNIENVTAHERKIYKDVYIFSVVWYSAGVCASLVALCYSCILLLFLRRSLDLIEMTPKATESWQFVRIRSSTPKSNKGRQVELARRRLDTQFSGPKYHPPALFLHQSSVGYFDDITPIPMEDEANQKMIHTSEIEHISNNNNEEKVDVIPDQSQNHHLHAPKTISEAVESGYMVAPITPNEELYTKIMKNAQRGGDDDQNANTETADVRVLGQHDYRRITLRKLNATDNMDDRSHINDSNYAKNSFHSFQ